MADRERPLLAVLIDADNVPARFAEAIMQEITKAGEPALRRVYGDWSNPGMKGWSDQVHKLGLVAQQATANTRAKNASDIELVIDAMDILHSGRFDGFVLVSSDSDFTALASRLRENGLLVLGMGEEKAPESLRNVCNRFTFLENITSESMQKDSKSPKTDLNHAYQRIQNAMKQIDQEDEWYNLGRVGQALVDTYPDFDTRSYGYSKLSDLVKKSPKLEWRTHENKPQVRLKP